jgi:hypothetical protein
MSQAVSPEDYALNALNAITREDTEAARQHIGALGFRGRALLTAWAGELLRLAQDEQSHYELLERRATRERRELDKESAARHRAPGVGRWTATEMDSLAGESGTPRP